MELVSKLGSRCFWLQFDFDKGEPKIAKISIRIEINVETKILNLNLGWSTVINKKNF